MESIERLKELDRAAAAPFVHYPTLPGWYPPAAGLWFAAVAAGSTLAASGWLAGLALLVVACVALAGFSGWYRARWGTWPDMRQAPHEIRKAYRTGLLWVPGLIVAGVVACWWGGAVVGAGVTFVVAAGWTWWYERRVYPAACRRLQDRLA